MSLTRPTNHCKHESLRNLSIHPRIWAQIAQSNATVVARVQASPEEPLSALPELEEEAPAPLDIWKAVNKHRVYPTPYTVGLTGTIVGHS